MLADLSKIRINGTIYNIKDAAVRERVTTIESTLSSSLTFKGVAASASAISSLTNYKTGWTYKVTDRFLFDGDYVENGDMIIAIADYDDSFSYSDWTVIQSNVDLFDGASASSGGIRGLVPAPAAGEQNKFLKGDGTWSDLPLVSLTKLSVAADENGTNGYIPVYLDVNGKLCISKTGMYDLGDIAESSEVWGNTTGFITAG